MTDTKPSHEVRALTDLLSGERRRQGMSASALARKMSELGYPCNRMVVANFESGRVSKPSFDFLLAVCRGLGMSILVALERTLPACTVCSGRAPEGFTCNTCGLGGIK